MKITTFLLCSFENIIRQRQQSNTTLNDFEYVFGILHLNYPFRSYNSPHFHHTHRHSSGYEMAQCGFDCVVCCVLCHQHEMFTFAMIQILKLEASRDVSFCKLILVLSWQRWTEMFAHWFEVNASPQILIKIK